MPVRPRFPEKRLPTFEHQKVGGIYLPDSAFRAPPRREIIIPNIKRVVQSASLWNVALSGNVSATPTMGGVWFGIISTNTNNDGRNISWWTTHFGGRYRVIPMMIYVSGAPVSIFMLRDIFGGYGTNSLTTAYDFAPADTVFRALTMVEYVIEDFRGEQVYGTAFDPGASNSISVTFVNSKYLRGGIYVGGVSRESGANGWDGAQSSTIPDVKSYINNNLVAFALGQTRMRSQGITYSATFSVSAGSTRNNYGVTAVVF